MKKINRIVIYFPDFSGLEKSPSNRAICFNCKRKIFKGEIRMIQAYNFYIGTDIKHQATGHRYFCSKCSQELLKIYKSRISFARKWVYNWLRRNKYKYALHEL